MLEREASIQRFKGQIWVTAANGAEEGIITIAEHSIKIAGLYLMRFWNEGVLKRKRIAHWIILLINDKGVCRTAVSCCQQLWKTL